MKQDPQAIEPPTYVAPLSGRLAELMRAERTVQHEIPVGARERTLLHIVSAPQPHRNTSKPFLRFALLGFLIGLFVGGIVVHQVLRNAASKSFQPVRHWISDPPHSMDP